MPTELIKALTPIALAICGVIIGVLAISTNSLDATSRTGALGVASAAISGAAGLANSNPKDKSDRKRTETDQEAKRST